MKNLNPPKYLFAIAILLLSGCAAYYPQAVDIPLIRKKGDLRIDAGFFLAHDFHESGKLAFLD